MYFIWICRVISIIYWTNFYVFARDRNLFLAEQQRQYDDDRKLLLTGDNNNNNNQKYNKSSWPVILRMIAVRIQSNQNDDESQQSSEVDESNNVQKQRNVQLLLLPFIIRMLLARIANHSNMISTTELNQISDRNDKLNSVYETTRKFFNLSNQLTTIEKLTLAGSMFLTFFMIIFLIYSIKQRLRDFARLRTIHLDKISIDQKLNEDEIEKLLQ